MNEIGNRSMKDASTIIAEWSEAQQGCPVTFTYTFDEIRDLLKGFDIVKIEKDHIFVWDIEKYKQYEYFKSKEWEGVSDEELKKFEKELGWHTMVVAKLA